MRFAYLMLLACLFPLAAAPCDSENPPVVGTCPEGYTQCGAVCVDLTSHDAHCGACDVACGGGSICSDSVCACPFGGQVCGETCFDTQTDHDHCGACDVACSPFAECIEGTCVCARGTLDCDGECVIPVDAANCGGCGVVCGDGVCDNGHCVAACPEGRVDCGGTCTSLTSSDHCGACDAACGPHEICTSEGCVDPCPAGFGLCGAHLGTDICVFLNSEQHCGACDVQCGSDEICVHGACQSASCAPDVPVVAECDGELVTLTEPEHCGGCDQACPLGEPYCSYGPGADGCRVTTCSDNCTFFVGSDYRLCGNEEFPDGCKDLQHDPEHCGACFQPCAPGEVCIAGTCDACPPENVCEEGCFDLDSDPAHCGSCTSACPDAQACVNGVCTCENGGELCGDACADLDTDPDHCGGCDTACLPTEQCVAGVCGCSEGEVCDGRCVDTATDEEHCGACDFPCASGQACVDGLCVCPPGHELCGGVCRDVASDEANCGGCGVTCGSGQACLQGRCVTELSCQAVPSVSSCTTLPIDLDACGALDAVESDVWQGIDITATQAFPLALQANQTVSVSGTTAAPSACCGGGVVDFAIRTADEVNLQTTQFVSPNDGSSARLAVEQAGSMAACSHPDHALFGAIGSFDFLVERTTLNGDYNAGGADRAHATPLAVDVDTGGACAQACGVNKGVCGDTQQFFSVVVPAHRALAIDFAVRGGFNNLDVQTDDGAFVCTAASTSGSANYVTTSARIVNAGDVDRTLILAPTSVVFPRSEWNLAVGLEDATLP